MIKHADKFYYDESKLTYYKPMQVAVTSNEGKLYHFAVNAVDKDGNELPRLTSFSTRIYP